MSTCNPCAPSKNYRNIAARVYSDAAPQEILTITDTPLTFNEERFDTDEMFDVALPTRLTIKTAGKYQITGNAIFEPDEDGGARRLQIRLNGTTVIATAIGEATTLEWGATVSTLYQFQKNDYVELVAYQGSGNTISVLVSAETSPEFMAVRVAPSGN